ncbi:ARL14 effector protein [Topomyia yanbarensis]|uniref:ARL14 effector protein n=1 Tax=Topomyia yanbarensis TaxID=2498891 RepID=UPI00273BC9F4|nr:ARL14 effector protein [Topomyia yanbarensis]XP_058831180.1 ARL14 effector protein [Topomyia yanbarensis]
MDECVEIESSDEEPQHVERGSRESERIGISSASSSPHPQPQSERSDTPVSANLRNSSQAMNRARRNEIGQLKKLETDPKFLANFNPQTSRREKRKLNRKSTPLVVPKVVGLYTDRGVHRETGRDMCDCLDLSCPGCHFPCLLCGTTKCGSHCRVNRKWMYESIEHDAKDLVIRNKLLLKK